MDFELLFSIVTMCLYIIMCAGALYERHIKKDKAEAAYLMAFAVLMYLANIRLEL